MSVFNFHPRVTLTCETYSTGAMGGQPGMQYPGMPAVMGSPAPNVTGMQMTGGSAFDSRVLPHVVDNNAGLQPPGTFQGQGQGQGPSRNSSPVGCSSPARVTEYNAPRPSSGQSSPRPPPQ